MSLEIETKGFADLMRQVSRIAGDADEAAVLAVNRGARDGRVLAARRMTENVNFPRGYLNDERLKITRYANRGSKDPEAVIRGRDRPTSLARFATTKPRFGRQKGVRVRVSPTNDQQMDSAFFLRLNNSNIGLAVRVKPGQSLRNSRGAKDIGNGLFLLYGPSVDQVFRGIAEDISDDITLIMRAEFLRQFARLNDGR